MNCCVAYTVSVSNNIHTNIFQNNLNDNDTILPNSHANSMNPINSPNKISRNFVNTIHRFVTLPVIHIQ